MPGDLPLIDGAFRFAGFRSFFGRMVSLLGRNRRLPSTRPDAERSELPSVACATEGTVSVSTVMFREGASVRDLMVERDDTEGFVFKAMGRANEAVRCSCILPLSELLSTPASLCFEAFVLRSSVTLDDVVSFRSSSVVLDAEVAAEGRLQ
jgi:hypothetical protein